jgi:hypothetical protein
MSRFVRVGCGVLIGGVMLAASSRLNAQQKGPPPKKGQAIEIRGQVPTPQVVTVRPREVPTYDRQLLAPAFYNGTGSTASTGAVQLVPESQVRGSTALDTTPAIMAHEGGVPTVGPLAVHPDSMRNARDTAATRAAATRAGASTAEIEAMRHELAVRRARLDSLQGALGFAQERSEQDGQGRTFSSTEDDDDGFNRRGANDATRPQMTMPVRTFAEDTGR